MEETTPKSRMTRNPFLNESEVDFNKFTTSAPVSNPLGMSTVLKMIEPVNDSDRSANYKKYFHTLRTKTVEHV